MAQQGSDQETWDQRANPVTEDSNSMTIEFLRARLLAERAVSKSAREKADELAKRVAELEEQLKIVSLQRKKAEKATADVLAILEENGYTDVSETFDSSSDHESFYETNMGESSNNAEEGPVDSKARNNEMEFSASEHGSLAVPCKNISWKGRGSEPSSDKFKESRTRRQRSFESIYFSSPRPRQGKSCRQIRRRESRSVVEDHKRDGKAVDFEESEVNKSEILPKATEEAPNQFAICADIKKDKDSQKAPNSNGLEDQYNINTNMERALECHAQLIGHFEDMERAQREWEEKFRDRNVSTTDLNDPGSHSDVTDESNETKTQTQNQGTGVCSDLGARPETNAVDFLESFEKPSHVSPKNSESSSGNQFLSNGSNSVDQDVSLPGGTGKYIQGRPKIECSHPQTCCNSDFHGHSLPTSLSPRVSQPSSGSSSYCSGANVIQEGADPLVPVAQENSNGCSTVLTALKQARLSLQAKVSSLHLSKAESAFEGSYPSLPASRINTCAQPTKPAFVAKPSLCASKIGHMAEVPVDCAGLFRVPSDFSSDVSKTNNFLASPPQITSHLHETEVPVLSGDHLFSTVSMKYPVSTGRQTHLADATTPVTTDDRPLTTPYVGGSKLWSGFRTDDPLIDVSHRFRPYVSIPSVSDSPVSSETFACIGNRSSPGSLCFDRQPNLYTGSPSFHPSSTSSLPTYRVPVLHGMERFSTSFGLPPIDRLASNNFRRNIYKQ